MQALILLVASAAVLCADSDTISSASFNSVQLQSLSSATSALVTEVSAIEGLTSSLARALENFSAGPVANQFLKNLAVKLRNIGTIVQEFVLETLMVATGLQSTESASRPLVNYVLDQIVASSEKLKVAIDAFKATLQRADQIQGVEPNEQLASLGGIKKILTNLNSEIERTNATLASLLGALRAATVSGFGNEMSKLQNALNGLSIQLNALLEISTSALQVIVNFRNGGYTLQFLQALG